MPAPAPAPAPVPQGGLGGLGGLPAAGGGQQEEAIRAMMQNPMAQAMLSNPDIVRAMMQVGWHAAPRYAALRYAALHCIALYLRCVHKVPQAACCTDAH